MIYQTLRWISLNDLYAKTVVHLAGIKTTPTEGIPISVSAIWSERFIAPVNYAIRGKPFNLVWSGFTKELLFRRTLGQLSETFRELFLPPCWVIFFGIISDRDKKPHYEALNFWPAEDFIPFGAERIETGGFIDETESVENSLCHIRKMKRRLRGIGYT